MHKTVHRLFIFILIFAPLAFGTVEQWSVTIMQITIFAALLLYLYVRSETLQFYEIPGLLPLLLLLGYILLQLVPLPMNVMRFLSPATHGLYLETVAIVDPHTWVSLSINKKATLAEFYRFASYVAFYVLTVQLLHKKEKLKEIVLVVIGLATFLAVLAIIQKFTAQDKIYWFRSVAANATPTGPYVYHNHFAGLMEMIFPIVMALFFLYKPKVVYETSFRERIVAIFNQQGSYFHVLLGFSAVLIATSVFVSLSRGGMISLSLALLVLVIMLLRYRSVPGKRVLFYLFIPALVVFSVGWFGWEPILERFGKIYVDGTINELRLDIWRDSFQIIKDFYLFGTGFGTYEDIYPAYQSITTNNLIVDHAHNDYLELLTDGGIIALFLVLWFMTVLFRKSFETFHRRRENYSVYLFLGCLTGMIAIFIHSFVDFNLQNPANGLYFFFLAGLLVSAVNTRLRSKTQETLLQSISIPKLPVAINATLGTVVLTCLLFSVGILAGMVRFSSIKNMYLDERIPQNTIVSVRNTAAGAAFTDPLEGKYKYAIANASVFIPDTRSAVANYKKAIKLHPVKGEYYQRLGQYMAALQENEAAGNLLKAAVLLEQKGPDPYKEYAKWLFAQGEKELGIDNIKKVISLDPKKINEYIYLMALYRVSDDDIGRAVPMETKPQFFYAKYLSDIGQYDLAETAYHKMLGSLEKDGAEPRAWYFFNMYHFYRKQGRFNEGLHVLLQGIKMLPDHAGLRFAAGQVYERLGINYRAMEEYQKGLTIDPGNEKIRVRFSKLQTL